MGRALGRRPTHRTTRRRTRAAATDNASDHRRGRLYPVRSPGLLPDVHARPRRYERASLIVTSNKAFSAWGEIFGDDVVAAAMIDRLRPPGEILAPHGHPQPPT